MIRETFSYERKTSFHASHGDGFRASDGIAGLRIATQTHETHEHEFNVEVEIRATALLSVGEGYVFPDEAIDDVMIEWTGKNLSRLPEFAGSGKRASAENLAGAILYRLERRAMAIGAHNIFYFRVSVSEDSGRKGTKVKEEIL